MNLLRYKKICFIVVAALALLPAVSSGAALLCGMALALTLGNPLLAAARQWSKTLLQIAIVGLGAGIDLHVIARAGAHGVGYTVAGIAAALGAGLLLGRWLRTERDTSLLLSVGTAICGGSAIAAVAAAIKPRAESTSLALAAVFVLNAVGLGIFPWLGYQLNFSQAQFGLWSALAIHDTSAVVGAAMQYGPDALQIATTIKLTRALWIVPLTLAIAAARRTTGPAGAPRGARQFPWFILGFLAVSAVVTLLPALQPGGLAVAALAKRVLVLALFLIGSTITRDALRGVGWRVMAHAVLLWITVATASAVAVHYGVSM